MPVINRIAAIHDEMTAWRRDIHAHPELGFEEERTAAIVAGKLDSFGIAVHRGLAKTGVVGVLEGAPGEGAIALRADMDALPILEGNAVPHRSVNDGAMHACGHDGHTTMLLGAARYLAETRNFAGTVYFVFQPAEEGLGGGEAMVQEGLFERFPAHAVYGMHNWPGLPAGEIAVRTGPMMAACDEFTITVEGTGAHGAMPHLGIDPIVAAAQIVTALQTIVARSVDPLEAGVVSVTKMHGGDAFNVIPEKVELAGTVRTFKPEVRDLIASGIDRIAESSAAALGAKAHASMSRHASPPRSTRRPRPSAPKPPPQRWWAPPACTATWPPAWAPRISPTCLRPGPAATSGSATASAPAAASSTTPATTSTTRSCPSAPATGPRWWRGSWRRGSEAAGSFHTRQAPGARTLFISLRRRALAPFASRTPARVSARRSAPCGAPARSRRPGRCAARSRSHPTPGGAGMD